MDDDATVRSALSRMLRSRYDVVEASGVSDLARLLSSDAAPLDAAIVDYELKDGDGFDAHRLLSSQRPALDGRMILFTGSELDESLRRRASEAIMFLVQKSDIQELRRVLGDLLTPRA